MSEKTEQFVSFKKDQRGFTIGEFKDYYDAVCSIHESSLASNDAIWLGVNCAEPTILARDAARIGRKDLLTTKRAKEGIGWVDYPLPQEVVLTTRMHLTRDQVTKLLPILQYFVDNGELPEPNS